ncbi:MAG: sugar transferase [Muribaculaceae bacterium]|nr:sugar transferase [Muribaculaceae bacterium]
MDPLYRQRLRYIACDYVMLNIGWLVFNYVRFRSLPIGWVGSVGHFMALPPVVLGQVLLPLLAVGIYALSGYYNHPYFKSRVDDVLNTAGVSAVAALMMFFAVLVNDDIPERLLNYQLLAILWALLAVPVYAGRHYITAHTRRRIRSGRLGFDAIVVGAGPKARALAARVERAPAKTGLRIAGFATDGAADGAMSLDDAALMVEQGRVRNIIIADESTDMARTADLMSRFIPLGCNVYMAPDRYNLLTMRPSVQSVSNEPLINISSPGMSACTANLKRIGDIVVSALAMVALLPVYAVLAIAVKADSAGPALYSQERVGYRGRLFRIYKFRTMRPDAEAAGPQLSRDGDPRITRVGAVLRKYRLDELPQFWNVLLGQMSLVGPRPEREHFERLMAERAPYVALLHRVRPGLTSWGVVKHGYACSVDEMLERLSYDMIYIENVSLGVDLRIILHTINTVLTGKGV